MAAVAGPVMVGVTGIRGTPKWTKTFRDPGLGVRDEGFDDIGPDGKAVLEKQAIYMRSSTKGHVTMDARGRVESNQMGGAE